MRNYLIIILRIPVCDKAFDSCQDSCFHLLFKSLFKTCLFMVVFCLSYWEFIEHLKIIDSCIFSNLGSFQTLYFKKIYQPFLFLFFGTAVVMSHKSLALFLFLNSFILWFSNLIISITLLQVCWLFFSLLRFDAEFL